MSQIFLMEFHCERMFNTRHNDVCSIWKTNENKNLNSEAFIQINIGSGQFKTFNLFYKYTQSRWYGIYKYKSVIIDDR